MRFRPMIIPTTGEFVRTYDDYLESIHWSNRKQQFAMIMPRYCVICGSIHNLNIHHLTYERLGNESIYDLVYLCENCHRQWHIYLRYQNQMHRRLRQYRRY